MYRQTDRDRQTDRQTRVVEHWFFLAGFHSITVCVCSRAFVVGGRQVDVGVETNPDVRHPPWTDVPHTRTHPSSREIWTFGPEGHGGFGETPVFKAQYVGFSQDQGDHKNKSSSARFVSLVVSRVESFLCGVCLQVISRDDHKRNLAYAQLLINYILFKRFVGLGTSSAWI